MGSKQVATVWAESAAEGAYKAGGCAAEAGRRSHITPREELLRFCRFRTSHSVLQVGSSLAFRVVCGCKGTTFLRFHQTKSSRYHHFNVSRGR